MMKKLRHVTHLYESKNYLLVDRGRACADLWQISGRNLHLLQKMCTTAERWTRYSPSPQGDCKGTAVWFVLVPPSELCTIYLCLSSPVKSWRRGWRRAHLQILEKKYLLLLLSLKILLLSDLCTQRRARTHNPEVMSHTFYWLSQSGAPRSL